jgi:hypothetical protein
MATKSRTKQFKIDFYTIRSPLTQRNPLTSLLSASENITEALNLNSEDSEKFQIRSIVSIADGMAYKAVFGRSRYGETPQQGAEDGSEEDVQLKPGHGLVEKNHFIFFPDRNLVIYQRNSSGSHYSKFQRYIERAAAAQDVTLEPILTRDSYERLLNNDVDARSVDISFLPPRDPSLYQGTSAKQAIELLNSFGGARARIMVSAGRGEESLLSSAKTAAVLLAKAGLARVARVKIEGEIQPIDLIADRIVETETIPLEDNGRPTPENIYNALDRAKDRRLTDINAFFGT